MNDRKTRQGEYQSKVDALREKYLTQVYKMITGDGRGDAVDWSEPANADRVEREAVWLALAELFELNRRRLQAAKAILDE